MSSWLLVIGAGVLEVVWAAGLRQSRGFTLPGWTVLTVIGIAASMWMLALSVRTLPVGTAYAVWVGVGVCGSALFGAWVFGEHVPPVRVLFLVMLVVAIIGLKLTAHPAPA